MVSAQTVNNVKLTDLQTQQTTDLTAIDVVNPRVSEIISAAPDYPDHQLFTCTSNGVIGSLDTRQRNSYCVKFANPEANQVN